MCSNNGEFNPNVNTPSMTQEMGFGSSFTSLSAHDQVQLARIKEELASSSVHHSTYPRFTEMLNSSSSSSIEDLHLLHHSSDDYLKNEQRNLLRTFSSGCQINGFQLPGGGGGGEGGFYSSPQQKYYTCPMSAASGTTAARGTFSQILPTINISNLNQSAAASNSTLSSSSLNMNLESLDLFNSARFSSGYSQSPHDHLGLFKSSLPYSLQNMQLQLSPSRPSSNCPTNVSIITILFSEFSS